MKKVILNLGTGTLSKGCETVIGEILQGDRSYPIRFTGQLPAAPELAATQQQWQQLYYARNQDQTLRIQLLHREGLRYSEAAFSQLCATLATQLNDWLNAPAFRVIDQRLRTELKRTDNIQIIVETTDTQLCKLPWHLWQLLQDYPRAELTFSTCDWRSLPPQRDTTAQARILAAFGNTFGGNTFGNSGELNLAADLTALSDLPKTDLIALESPTLTQLHELLWQSQGWDIFFFAGHSQTHGNVGVIDLNSQERLTIEQIKYALSKAIENGLKIAVFNSCDGLGLAQQLSELQIPYVVVMREPVPDHIAQQFLRYLLKAFAEGAPFHLAVREARQRLAGLEGEIPCASWLPVIWQNPTAPAIYWRDLHAQPLAAPTLAKSIRRQWRSLTLKSLLVGGIVLAMRALGLLEPFELSAYDHLLRSRPAELVDSRIVVVEISQEITSDYGYPLPDETLTQLIDKVAQAQPLAIGLDLHRAKPNPAREVARSQVLRNQQADNRNAGSQTAVALVDQINSPSTGYAKFLQQVEEMPNLFLVCFRDSTDENYGAPAQLPLPLQIDQMGFSDLPVDGARVWLGGSRGDLTPQGSTALTGEVVRRQVLSYDPSLLANPSACTTPYSFGFQMAYQYLYEKKITPLEVTADEHWRLGSVVFKSLPQRFGGYQQLDTPISQVLLNYRANQPGQKITVEQLFANDFDPQLLRDRVVMVGYTAPVSKDYFATPYGPMAGLWVHAHMASQLMSAVLDDRPLIHTLPQWRSWQWGDWLWVLTWSGVGASVAWVGRRRSHWLLSVALSLLLLYGLCWLALISGLWLPLIPGALATLGSTVWIRLSRHSWAALPE